MQEDFYPPQKDQDEYLLKYPINYFRRELEIPLQPHGREPFEAWLTVVANWDGKQRVLHWSIRDVTEHKKAEQARLHLLDQLVTAQEETSRIISREMHDQIGQSVTALILGLKAIEGRSDPDLKDQVRKLVRIAEEMGVEVHDIALSLRPTALDDLGLAPVIENYAEEWSERNHIPVDYQAANVPENLLSMESRITVYRMIQEALNNVAKHAHAQQVSLILEKIPEFLTVIVEDDGCGFDVETILNQNSSKGRLGLLGMRERAELIGGTLSIESDPGNGTTVFLRVPLQKQETM